MSGCHDCQSSRILWITCKYEAQVESYRRFRLQISNVLLCRIWVDATAAVFVFRKYPVKVCRSMCIGVSRCLINSWELCFGVSHKSCFYCIDTCLNNSINIYLQVIILEIDCYWIVVKYLTWNQMKFKPIAG